MLSWSLRIIFSLSRAICARYAEVNLQISRLTNILYPAKEGSASSLNIGEP